MKRGPCFHTNPLEPIEKDCPDCVDAVIERARIYERQLKELLAALKDLVALYEASPGRDPIFVEKGLAAIAKVER